MAPAISVAVRRMLIMFGNPSWLVPLCLKAPLSIASCKSVGKDLCLLSED